MLLFIFGVYIINVGSIAFRVPSPQDLRRETEKLCTSSKCGMIFKKHSFGGKEKPFTRKNDPLQPIDYSFVDGMNQTLVQFKSLDVYNKYPLLMWIMDLWKRDMVARDHYSSKREIPLGAKEWFNGLEYDAYGSNAFCKYIKYLD